MRLSFSLIFSIFLIYIFILKTASPSLLTGEWMLCREAAGTFARTWNHSVSSQHVSPDLLSAKTLKPSRSLWKSRAKTLSKLLNSLPQQRGKRGGMLIVNHVTHHSTHPISEGFRDTSPSLAWLTKIAMCVSHVSDTFFPPLCPCHL